MWYSATQPQSACSFPDMDGGHEKQVQQHHNVASSKHPPSCGWFVKNPQVCKPLYQRFFGILHTRVCTRVCARVCMCARVRARVCVYVYEKSPQLLKRAVPESFFLSEGALNLYLRLRVEGYYQ